MASLRKLHNCRRNAAATVASAAFLALLLILSVALVATRRDHAHPIVGTFIFSGAPPTTSAATTDRSCEAELRALPDAAARCGYLSSPSHRPCAPRGYVHYLRVFYCAFGGAPWLGAAALGLWLLLLFYLLGDTASRYFCAALEGLSAALRLPLPRLLGPSASILGAASRRRAAAATAPAAALRLLAASSPSPASFSSRPARGLRSRRRNRGDDGRAAAAGGGEGGGGGAAVKERILPVELHKEATQAYMSYAIVTTVEPVDARDQGKATDGPSDARPRRVKKPNPKTSGPSWVQAILEA